ncbi:MAG: hypothetical protein HQ537_02600 [Parcubacteria group bacterium]|nr:hypothetical protein [Parcubacteria group bacterium]
MAFGDKMDKVMLYNRNSNEIPSGIGGREDCFFCDDNSTFVVIGQRRRFDAGDYVQRRTCQSADCILRAIEVVKRDTGL